MGEPEGEEAPLALFQGEFGELPVRRFEDRDYEDFREWIGGFDLLEDPSLRGEYPHFPVGIANEPGPLRMAPMGVAPEVPGVDLPAPVDRRNLPMRCVYYK